MPSPVEIQIRAIVAEDVEAFRALRLRALREHPEAFGSDYQTQSAFPPEFWQARVSSNLANPDQIVFVATDGDELLGMTGIRRQHDSPKTMHNAGIWGVYVAPEARGHGLADRLLAACRDWARTVGVRLIRLGVVVDNASALACYRRCGYREYGRDPKAISWQGRDYDELLMVLEL